MLLCFFTVYRHFLFRFFVLEDHIMNTASGLVTRAYRDELWEVAASHVEKTLNNHFVSVKRKNEKLFFNFKFGCTLKVSLLF